MDDFAYFRIFLVNQANIISIPDVQINKFEGSIHQLRMSEIVLTGDGSHTLYVKELDEYYHSIHGAIQESRHVYIEAGFLQVNKPHINILEMGFGTGLNTFMTLMEAQRTQTSIHYTGIEKYPLSYNDIKTLNYPDFFPEEFRKAFSAIHDGPWNETFSPAKDFHLTRVKVDICEHLIEGDIDLVYYDAFAPSKQPELWTAEIFRKIHKALSPGGILTTYAVKGELRRTMASVGFLIEKLPGPPGKFEMMRARKVL